MYDRILMGGTPWGRPLLLLTTRKAEIPMVSRREGLVLAFISIC